MFNNEMIFKHSLLGMDIIEAPVKIVPKLKLRDDCPVTDEFREEFNAWLLDMFGTRDDSIIPFGMCYAFGNTLVMRPEQMAIISNCAV